LNFDVVVSKQATISTMLLLSNVIFLAGLFDSIHAFQDRLPSVRQPFPFLRPDYVTSTPHFAIIYDPDDEEEGVWEEDDDVTTATDHALLNSMLPLLDIPLLMRVACAFAPSPNNNLHPKDTLGAELVSLSPMGAKIVLSVSVGGDNAAQILVPIKFDDPCYSNAGILTAFQKLEKRAVAEIAEIEYEEDNADELIAQQQVILCLQKEPMGVDLPTWWTYSDLNKGLEEECSLMKDLLNEDDFALEISAVFQTQYRKEKIQVIKTCAALVGPSGLYLRAYVERVGDYDEDRMDKYLNAELTLKYERKAQSREEVRSSIFDLIESAGMNLQEVGDTAETVEEGAIPTIEVVVEINAKRAAYVFQKSLLEARLQMEQLYRNGKQDNSYAFQKRLLEARLRMDRAAFLKVRKRKLETFQRRLLETRILYDCRRKVKVRSDVSSTKEISVDQLETVQTFVDQARLAEKYAQIEDIGERAFEILRDLRLI
jgi:hypothetical protein